MFRQLQSLLFFATVIFCSFNLGITAQVENDESSNAIALELGSNGPFSNVDATASADDLAGGACGTDGAGDGWFEPEISNTVWFTYTGTGGEVTIQSGTGCGDDGSNNDTQFAVYEGAADGPLVICADDISGSIFYSSVNFVAEDGVTYFLLVDGWDGTVGEFCLDLVDPSAVECGDGVCDPGETFETCLADCPCTPNPVWVDDINLVGSPDIFFNCGFGTDTLGVPVAIFGAGETDQTYVVSTNIGNLENDTTATATIVYLLISQEELNASDGQLTVTFDGVGFEGQCLGVLEADLIAETGGDIATFCEELNACPADAGVLTVEDGEASVAGNNLSNDFISVFLLTNNEGDILEYNSDGDFTALADGSYFVSVLNIEESSINGNIDLFFILYNSLGALSQDIETDDICAELTELPVAFTVGDLPCEAEAGMLNPFPEPICLGDEFTVSSTGFVDNPAYINAYLLTAPFDPANGLTALIISQISLDGTFTANEMGTFSVMAVSILEEQLPVPIDQALGLDANLIGTVVPCFDNDIAAGENFINILGENECCTAMAGTITTTDSTTVCVGDTIPDFINVSVEGNVGANHSYIVTNETGSIFLAGPNTTGVFDFNDVAVGVCQIWGIAYDGEITLPESGEPLVIEGSCYELSNSIEVTREMCPVVGLENISNNSSIGISHIAPMPGKDKIFMDFELTGDAKKVMATVYDLTGKEKASLDAGNRPIGPNTMTIDISQLATGMYVIQLSDGKMVDTIRFIKE